MILTAHTKQCGKQPLKQPLLVYEVLYLQYVASQSEAHDGVYRVFTVCDVEQFGSTHSLTRSLACFVGMSCAS